MNFLVTAGPTYEPLDEVRRLTNFSTGKLGSELAGFLARQGHTVTLLLGHNAANRTNPPAQTIETFTTTADLQARIQRLSSQRFDAVLHAAAVSDFGFGKIWERTSEGLLAELHGRKLPTRQGTLLAELVPTPKVIAGLRGWFPQATLIGWKYEVDGNRAEAIAKAVAQIATCRTNASVVNGCAYGTGYGLVKGQARWTHFEDSAALFRALAELFET
jgi:phosphopantothenoylcysteine synthetase/decarboxylase